MAGPDYKEDLKGLIDLDLEAFLGEGDKSADPSRNPKKAGQDKSRSQSSNAPALDEAVDSLFSGTFRIPKPPAVTSGDDETDRAIDLAVETLFVEEIETAPPVTTEVRADLVQDTVVEEGRPRPPEPPVEEEALIEPEVALDLSEPALAAEEISIDIEATVGEFEPAIDGDIVLEPDAGEGIEIDIDLTTEEEPPPAEVRPSRPVRAPATAVAPPRAPEPSRRDTALRKLQEAILTLEWEISARSVKALAAEIQRVRTEFRDDVTVDFAALAMRVVLGYVVKRMSRAHPESIRFLLEVTGYFKDSTSASVDDPLVLFHQILSRYEKYKSVVRRAEGIPDKARADLGDLRIGNPRAFYRVVKSQASMLALAGHSLAKRIRDADDPENLIRSFRFLVNRSMNRILEATVREGTDRKKKRKGVPGRPR